MIFLAKGAFLNAPLPLVAGTWTETKKCITVDFFLKLADDDV